MNEDFNLKAEDFINARERFIPPPKLEPKMDMLVSKIVGKKIYQHDPRLIKLIVKWKGNKPENSPISDNFLRDPVKIKELKEVLNGNL